MRGQFRTSVHAAAALRRPKTRASSPNHASLYPLVGVLLFANRIERVLQAVLACDEAEAASDDFITHFSGARNAATAFNHHERAVHGSHFASLVKMQGQNVTVWLLPVSGRVSLCAARSLALNGLHHVFYASLASKTVHAFPTRSALANMLEAWMLAANARPTEESRKAMLVERLKTPIYAKSIDNQAYNDIRISANE